MIFLSLFHLSQLVLAAQASNQKINLKVNLYKPKKNSTAENAPGRNVRAAASRCACYFHQKVEACERQ
jgi:hypothetical protein